MSVVSSFLYYSDKMQNNILTLYFIEGTHFWFYIWRDYDKSRVV